jgi:small subunit ribosomal protein S13
MSESEEEYNHIVRMSSHDLRGEWYVTHALSRITGVGNRLAHVICNIVDIPLNVRIGFLTQEEIEKIEAIIQDPIKYNIPPYMLNRQKDIITGQDMHVHANDLAIALKNDIDRMKKTRSYKGIRHQLGLRVRGQHTRTTGRRSGRSVGVSRKK